MNKLEKFLWWTAIVLEWVAIPLHLAAMGYDIKIGLYQMLKNFQYINMLYYCVAALDITLFYYFVLKFRKQKDMRSMLVSLLCCMTQVGLLIYKVKL